MKIGTAILSSVIFICFTITLIYTINTKITQSKLNQIHHISQEQCIKFN